jgi:hypothetical protein
VPQFGWQFEELKQPGVHPEQLMLQVMLAVWYPALHEVHELNAVHEQPVHAPHWQDELHVRVWHGPQPSALVAPMTHTGVPFSSHPSESESLQSLQPGSQTQPPELQRECAPQLLPQEPQFETSLSRFASQPLVQEPSQFW